MKRSTILIAAGALLASSCFLEDLFGPLGSVMRGTVSDVRNRTMDQGPIPAAGIVVRLGDDPERFATTDADGRFEFTVVGTGECLNVSLALEDVTSHPASHAVCVGGNDIEGINFLILPGSGHRIEGTVSGAPGALVGTCCASVAFQVVESDGSFAFDHLPFLSYEVRAGIMNDPSMTFTPGVIHVQAVHEFEHAQSGDGTLGTMTVSSIMAGAADASGCFEVLFTGDGTGTIRLRTDTEIGLGGCAAYGQILSGSESVVVVTLGSDLGPQTVTIEMYASVIVGASSTSFALTARLIPSTGLHFTRSAP